MSHVLENTGEALAFHRIRPVWAMPAQLYPILLVFIALSPDFKIDHLGREFKGNLGNLVGLCLLL